MHHLTHVTLLTDHSYLEQFMHRRHYKRATHSIFTLFRNILELLHIFELPINWVKFDKKQKIFNFPTSTPSHLCDPLTNSSYLGKLVYRRCYKGATHSIFTLFRKNSELHHIFKLLLNWVKFNKKRKIFNFSTSTPSHTCDSLNELFISSVVGTQDTLQWPHIPPFLHFLESFL